MLNHILEPEEDNIGNQMPAIVDTLIEIVEKKLLVFNS